MIWDEERTFISIGWGIMDIMTGIRDREGLGDISVRRGIGVWW